MLRPVWLLAAIALAGCSTTRHAELTSDAPARTYGVANPRPAIACSDGYSTLDSDFAGSAMAGCQVLARGHYRLLIRQEDRNVTNCSAWYAFRVQAATETEIVVDLDYERCGHRYAPKLWIADEGNGDCSAAGRTQGKGILSRIARLISRHRGGCQTSQDDTPAPGAQWTAVPTDRFVVEGAGEGEIARARLAIVARPAAQIISSQELLLPDDYDAWLSALERDNAIKRSLLGQSLEGLPIEMVRFGGAANTPREQLVVIGRQHPPEVTGAIALFAFTERLLEDDALARAFRARFETTVVPMLNPDGVMHGHWRHSKGERDLNRDWGPFTQPETRLMRDILEAIETDPTRQLRFFMDFHSTGYDVLYTLDKALVTDPPGFTDSWLANYQSRLPGYNVVEQAGHNPDSPVSKAWVYERFGVPTMTYEIGDATDRALVRRLGRAAAEATMVTMLGPETASD